MAHVEGHRRRLEGAAGADAHRDQVDRFVSAQDPDVWTTFDEGSHVPTLGLGVRLGFMNWPCTGAQMPRDFSPLISGDGYRCTSRMPVSA